MSEDRFQPPTEAALEARLGSSYPAYRALVDAYPELRPDWKWYGRQSGWSLKLLDGKRNLCFLHPGEQRFHVSFVFGHDAVERALESSLPVGIRQTIAAARTHAEGRGFKVRVTSEADLGPVHQLVAIKRGPARESAPRHHGARRIPTDRGTVAPPPRQPGGRSGAPGPGRTAPSHRRGRSPG